MVCLSLQVLEKDPTNAKALFRRGQAKNALKNWDDAIVSNAMTTGKHRLVQLCYGRDYKCGRLARCG